MEWRQVHMPYGSTAYIAIDGDAIYVATAYAGGWQYTKTVNGKRVATGWSRYLETIEETERRKAQRRAS